MASPIPKRLVDRVLSTGPITVLCAPPGFRKRRLMAALGEDWDTPKDVLFFDGIDHEMDARIAAKAILASEPQNLILISDTVTMDHQFVGNALERHLRKTEPASFKT